MLGLMVTTLQHGIHIHTSAEGAIVQNVKVTHKVEKSKLMATTAAHGTQYVKGFTFCDTYDFEVKGSGDLTMSAGLGQTLNISLLSGGVSIVDEFGYEQIVDKPSEWNYKGENLPWAA